LHVQLDNTSKDNKNRGTFGYFAYLVASGTFKKVVVSFLPVGHTHEDIDAAFGVIMRYLHRHRCLATMEALMDAIWDSFFVSTKAKSSWQPSAELEHIKGTHDWNRWLKKASEEGRTEAPLTDISNFALLVGEKACSDSRRPHRFEFSMVGSGSDQHVVMHYYRWCHDQEPWGEVPIVMFNYIPPLASLMPAKLRSKFMAKLKVCGNACKPDDQCPRCGVNAFFNNSHSVCGSLFTEDERTRWEQRFNDLTQAAAEADLPASLLLPKPHQQQASTFQMPSVCTLPETSQLPAPVEHSQYVLESKGKFTVAGLQKMLTDYKKAAKLKQGVGRSSGNRDEECNQDTQV
jgi:hypothetical protein